MLLFNIYNYFYIDLGQKSFDGIIAVFSFRAQP